MAIDKHGYVPEEKDSKIKEASEKGRCPLCGAEVTGKPPSCPNHGSEPFEKRERDGRR
jgi:hypothetical protein